MSEFIMRNKVLMVFLALISLAYRLLLLLLVCVSLIGILASMLGCFLNVLEVQSIFTQWEIKYSLHWWSYSIAIIGFTVLGSLSAFLVELPYTYADKLLAKNDIGQRSEA